MGENMYRKNIRPGSLVKIVLKKDQKTGELTTGSWQDTDEPKRPYQRNQSYAYGRPGRQSTGDFKKVGFE